MQFVLVLAASVGLPACLRLPESPQNPPVAAEPVANTKSATIEGYFVELDGVYPRQSWMKTEISPGCHIVIVGTYGWNGRNYSSSLRLRAPRQKYVRFVAKENHHYAVERTHKMIPYAVGSRSAVRVELVTVVESDAQGIETRRYFETSDEVAPRRC